ncbi:Golgi-associated PDZ and coiled-coil motif-containing protein [Gryllus bimaculatus]|nr:Golgi-associated PDZ and coiled-coil motif-containing protein [Gryllus bimaculatus]
MPENRDPLSLRSESGQRFALTAWPVGEPSERMVSLPPGRQAVRAAKKSGFSKERQASSRNSLFKVADTTSPGSTIPPGEFDSEEPDMVYTARQKMATLSSCFAQLTHKAQTIFQNSAKVEA